MNPANKNTDSAKPVIKQTGNAGYGKAKNFAVGVHLDSGGKVRDYLWNGADLPVGAACVVEENGALDVGKVALSRRPAVSSCCCKKASGKVVRLADKVDLDKVASNARKEKSAMGYCRERIYEMDLNMSLAKVKYSFDGKKAVFYFTAESRVDFRALVKELANYTRARVEMRQVGVRDEARQLGGCGPCGHELCCSSFLSDFVPVSIRMAKEQALALSPEKISGVCGRLMCCLAYEYPTYKELHKKAPRMGRTAQTPDGRTGKVCYLNLLEERVGILLEGGEKVEFNLSDLPDRGKGKPPESPKPARDNRKQRSADNRSGNPPGHTPGSSLRKAGATTDNRPPQESRTSSADSRHADRPPQESRTSSADSRHADRPPQESKTSSADSRRGVRPPQESGTSSADSRRGVRPPQESKTSSADSRRGVRPPQESKTSSADSHRGVRPPQESERKRRRGRRKTGNSVEQSAADNGKTPGVGNTGQTARPGSRRRRRRPGGADNRPPQTDAG